MGRESAVRPSLVDVNRDDYYAHGGTCLDARRSVFLTPTDLDAVPPPGWAARPTSLPVRPPFPVQPVLPPHLVECRLLPDGARPR